MYVLARTDTDVVDVNNYFFRKVDCKVWGATIQLPLKAGAKIDIYYEFTK